MSEIDLDNKINWPDFYRQYFPNMKQTNDKMMVKCCFHEDKNASAWFRITNGLFKCEACGASHNPVSFLATKENISNKEAFKKLLEIAGLKKDYEPAKEKKAEKKTEQVSYTVEEYAAEKKLPIEFLKNLNIKSGKKNGKSYMITPYMNESGEVTAKKGRFGNGSPIRFNWDGKPSLYGLWQLNVFKEKGFVILVEGESDSQTLWLNEYPTLGVPGASQFQATWVNTIKDFEKLYLHDECDKGGETFISKTCEKLAEAGYQGKVYKIKTNPKGFKDPSDLYINDPEKFTEKWKDIMDAAEEINITAAAENFVELMPGAPVKLKAINGFTVSDSGVIMRVIKGEESFEMLICNTPVIITRIMRSLDVEEEKIEIAFKKDNTWRKIIVQKSKILVARNITELLDIGINISSDQAKNMVKYFQELLFENEKILKVGKYTAQMGWHGKKFLPGVAPDIEPDTNLVQWFNKYHENGDFDGWIKQFKSHYMKNDIFRGYMATSFAAPLLKLVNGRTFFYHLWCDSRSGKTAMLKSALSVWGNPNEIMATFNGTKVAFERLAFMYNDLPMGTDERENIGKEQQYKIDEIIYSMSMGSSKLRGKKDGGLQDVGTWRTIILTTGEQPLAGDDSNSGVHTRALSVYGKPFDNENEARNIYDVIKDNYGMAGPYFIKKLIENKTNEEIRERHKVIKSALQLRHPNKLGSHVDAVALITLADEYVSEWIFNEKGDAIKLGNAMLNVLSEVSETDINQKTLDFIKNWIYSNEGKFRNDQKKYSPTESVEKYGIIKDENRVWVITNILKKALENAGLSYLKTLKYLSEKGIIEVAPDGKTSHSVRIGTAGTQRVLCFRFDNEEKQKAQGSMLVNDVLKIFDENVDDSFPMN